MVGFSIPEANSPDAENPSGLDPPRGRGGSQNEGKGKFAWEVPAGQVFKEVLFLLSLGQAGLYSTIGGWKEMEDN